jgi:hypothetical protein
MHLPVRLQERAAPGLRLVPGRRAQHVNDKAGPNEVRVKTRRQGIVYQQTFWKIDPDHRPKPPVNPKREPPKEKPPPVV